MKKYILGTVLVMACIGSSAVMAKGGGGGGSGGGSHGAAGAMGGHSAANSNGMKSLDRDKGLDRAADRRNSHSTAVKHAKKHKRTVQ